MTWRIHKYSSRPSVARRCSFWKTEEGEGGGAARRWRGRRDLNADGALLFERGGEKTGGVEQIDGRERLFCFFALFFFFPSRTHADSKNPIHYSSLSAIVRESVSDKQRQQKCIRENLTCFSFLSGLASLAFPLLFTINISFGSLLKHTCSYRQNDTHIHTHDGTTGGEARVACRQGR